MAREAIRVMRRSTDLRKIKMRSYLAMRDERVMNEESAVSFTD